MRKIDTLSTGWNFIKLGSAPEVVEIPHTWNAVDGTDGGNDYYRGVCRYEKVLQFPFLDEGKQIWLEFEGVSQSCIVFVNGKQAGMHNGGYSAFRFNITDLILPGENRITIEVDNSKNDRVYPQKADFTFYGGIYRDVKLITVSATHFALDYWGSSGVKITPVVEGKNARVTAEAWVEGEATQVEFSIAGQMLTASVENSKAEAEFLLENVHLWNGVDDPYLYTCTARLPEDEVDVKFGCRTIEFFPVKGYNIKYREGGRSCIMALTKEDLQAIADLMDVKIGASEQRLKAYIESHVEKEIRQIADGHKMLYEKMEREFGEVHEELDALNSTQAAQEFVLIRRLKQV